MLYGLDLFSGIGGITFALSEWIRPIAYVEKDAYCQSILKSRFATGDLPSAPVWDDVRSFDGLPLRGLVDIIYGGFPCQDISTAGLGKGLAGERSGLFFEIMRLAKEIEPAFLFLENVAAIRTRGLNTVGQELAALRYDCRWGFISAYDVGAPHLRERWFLLAHAKRVKLRHQQGRSRGQGGKGEAKPRNNGSAESMANSEGFHGGGKLRDLAKQNGEANRPKEPRENKAGQFSYCSQDVAHSEGQRWGQAFQIAEGCAKGSCSEGRSAGSSYCNNTYRSGWEVEPDVGRVVNGLPFRVDRIKSLGNAVVPAQAREAFKRLMGL